MTDTSSTRARHHHVIEALWVETPRDRVLPDSTVWIEMTLVLTACRPAGSMSWHIDKRASHLKNSHAKMFTDRTAEMLYRTRVHAQEW